MGRHRQPTYLRIRKRSFPLDGYIILDDVYAKLLKSYHSKYQIVPEPMFRRNKHSIHLNNKIENETIRSKRSDNLNADKVALTYCCMKENQEKCNAEHYCPM